MYLLVRKYKNFPSLTEDQLRKVKEEFVPLLKKQPGFVEYFYIKPKETGSLFTISVFEDEKSAQESNRLSADWRHRNMPEIKEEPETFNGDVIVHRFSAEKLTGAKAA